MSLLLECKNRTKPSLCVEDRHTKSDTFYPLTGALKICKCWGWEEKAKKAGENADNADMAFGLRVLKAMAARKPRTHNAPKPPKEGTSANILGLCSLKMYFYMYVLLPVYIDVCVCQSLWGPEEDTGYL